MENVVTVLNAFIQFSDVSQSYPYTVFPLNMFMDSLCERSYYFSLEFCFLLSRQNLPRRVFELSSVKNFRQISRLPFLDLCQFENMKKNVAVNINQTPCDLQQSSGFYLSISPEDPKFSANMLRITILSAVST